MARKKAEPVEEVVEVSADQLQESVEAEEQSVAEAIETASEPVGQSVTAAQAEPQPALTSAPRRSAREKKMEQEAHQAARNLRQEDAIIIGKYISAEKRNNVLSGKIAGVEVKDGHTFWVVYDGPVTVYIPCHEALPLVTKEVAADTVRQRQMLSKSIGAVVPYTVEALIQDGTNYLAHGSRRAAVARISNRYFGEDAPMPVQKGDDVTATFLAVGPHAAWANVCGLDVRLEPTQLSHRYIEDLMQVYKPGDEIKMRVQALRFENGKPLMRLSALPCELEECQTRHNRIRPGSRFMATITSHRVVQARNPRTGKVGPYYVASLWLESVNVAAYATLTSSHVEGTAHSGDHVMVEVNDIVDSGYVRCRIVSYLP